MKIEGGRRKEEQEGGRRKNVLSVALVALVVLLVLVLLVLLVLPPGGTWRPQGGPLGTPYLFITGVIIFYYVLRLVMLLFSYYVPFCLLLSFHLCLLLPVFIEIINYHEIL